MYQFVRPYDVTSSQKTVFFLSIAVIASNVTTYCKGKGKGKVHPRTGHVGREGEWRYSCTLSLTSALVGGGWSTPRPGRFTPAKDPVPILLGGPQGQSGRVRKISPPTGIRFPDRPSRSESLYRLSSRGPRQHIVHYTV